VSYRIQTSCYTGNWKVHRDVKIESKEDLSKQALKKLVQAALKAYAKRKKEK
jgi:hypothetical protein